MRLVPPAHERPAANEFGSPRRFSPTVIFDRSCAGDGSKDNGREPYSWWKGYPRAEINEIEEVRVPWSHIVSFGRHFVPCRYCSHLCFMRVCVRSSCDSFVVAKYRTYQWWEAVRHSFNCAVLMWPPFRLLLNLLQHESRIQSHAEANCQIESANGATAGAISRKVRHLVKQLRFMLGLCVLPVDLCFFRAPAQTSEAALEGMVQ